MKFYPYKNGGTNSFSHAEGGGGGTQSFEVVLTQELEVLAILMEVGGGGHQKFPSFKRGARKIVVCLEGGGGRKKFWTCDFPIS